MDKLWVKPDQLCWNYPAELKNVDEVCAQAVCFVEACPLAREDCFAIELLLHEALTNAVVHGCKEDPHLRVMGWLRVSGGEVIIEVLDEGLGFSWKCAAAEIPENLAETGRGLTIYRLYATTYQFNPEGNRVTLWRTLKKGVKNG